MASDKSSIYSDAVEDTISMKDASESVLSRERETKGLQSSVSSNLGYDAFASHSQSASNLGSRSVKSIIAWLEAASRNNNTDSFSKHSGDETKSIKSIGTIPSTESNSSLLSQSTIPNSEDVEEYDLNLLNYKKYFSEPPLSRCLDKNIALGSKEIVLPKEWKDLETMFSDVSTSNRRDGKVWSRSGNAERRFSSSSGGSSTRIYNSNVVSDLHRFHRQPEEISAF